MQVIFLGTPDFAVPTLNALIVREDINVTAIVTQPDRQSGRGQKIQAPAVKVLAEKYHIPVFQPEKLSKSKDVLEHLRRSASDLIVMVAYGQILKPEVLSIPKLGVINLHASLLPAYRGAAPINWAIINGDTISGITTMFTDAGLDTGPILLKQEIAIGPDTNAIDLSKQMSIEGAQLVIKTIDKLNTSQLVPVPQETSHVTYAPLLNKDMACINWLQPAAAIHNLVRGLVPWPVARTVFRNQSLKIWRTTTISKFQIQNMEASLAHIQPGTIILAGEQVLVACGQESWLELKDLQPANKSKLAAYDWANGMRLKSGEIFGSQE